MSYYVYMMTNATDVVLYTGVTNDLIRRVHEHRTKVDGDSFTAKHDVHKLVYYEETSDAVSAIEREKQIKGWNRRKKNKIVEAKNPQWKDLYDSLLE